MGTPENPETSNTPAPEFGELGGLVMIDTNQLRAVLTPARCLAALEDAYRRVHATPADNSQSLGFETRAGKFHVKAGLYPGTHEYFAAKVNANFPGNRARHALPTIQGLILLCDGGSGKPLAVLQSGELTGRRTAAATALAAKHGARPDSRTLAIVGCGVQARHHVEAIMGVLPITRITAYDCAPGAAEAFAAWTRQALGLETSAAKSVNKAVAGSDIVITCTTATEAIVMPGMAPPGCFIAAVGADNPDKQELDPGLFANSRILVDDLDQCCKSGDLAHAIRAGTAKRDDVAASLADLAAGARKGRTREEEIVIFDSTGTGLQDVAAAAAAYEAVK